MSDRRIHVVFGAGQIGTPLARILRQRGHEVRVVRRSAAEETEGITVLRGDAGDPAFAVEAARGAAALYHCMNPPYDWRIWERELPRIMQSLIAAARGAGARLVVLDNLYMLGPTGGRPMNEDTPVRPTSRKGAIRARVAESLFAAHRRGDVRAVSGRASDFYGPGGVLTFFGQMFWSRVLAGKSAQLVMNPKTPHTWHYTLDVAAGLAALGEADDQDYGKWWMLPASPAVPTREMVERMAEVLGRPVPVQRVPKPMLRVIGPFMPIVRELLEMSYQWDEPFLVDDRRFRARFGLAPTPLEEGVRATVAWGREAFAPEQSS